LLFQTLDDKKECLGVYYDGELFFDEALPSDLKYTWSYSPFLKDRAIEYAKLYCEGQTLLEAAPGHLIDRWGGIESKFKAYIKSFHTARVSLNENCFFDLVPEKFLLEMCSVKNIICEHVFENFERPTNYNYLLDLTIVLEEIKHQRLNINFKNLSLYKTKHRKFAKSLKSVEPYCKFNINGTKTGRLTTQRHSFPILTVDKELRGAIEPNNEYFLELDFNAAELRTLIALQGKPQPAEDLHEWNVKNVYRGLVTREEAKKRIFAWLYNPESDDHLSSRAYDRDSVVQKHFTQGQVRTFWGKTIPSEERTALNYVVQSTCAENVLRQVIRLHAFLQNKKSFIAFPIHDSVVIDFSIEDKDDLTEIINIFSDTDLGKFRTNVSVGHHFGNLQKLRG